MEAAGLGIGVAGLAGLFTNCIDCFELIQRGRYLGQEYLLLETKFANQKLRLLAWGRACGFMDSGGYDARLDTDDVRSNIEDTLSHLILLFDNGKELKKKYGLRREQASHTTSTALSSPVGALIRLQPSNITVLGQKLHDLRDRMRWTQKNTSLSSTVRWAIEDKRKFSELIQHLKDLIDDLEGLTKWLGVPERQREIIQCEVESISDIPTLETIEEARLGMLDAVSDAASLRLWKLRDQYVEGGRLVELVSQGRSSQVSLTSVDSEWDDLTENTENRPPVATETPYQVLYRVFCQHEPTSVFLDPPNYSSWKSENNQWIVLDAEHPAHEPTTLHLCGRRKIPNLDAYLMHNSQLLFVVFKNYECCRGLDQSKDPSSSARPLSVLPTLLEPAVPDYESMSIVSRELRDALDGMASTHPTRLAGWDDEHNMLAPYLHFYHTRWLIKELATWLPSSAKQSVRTLIEHVESSYGREYAEADELFARGEVSREHLAKLFGPNEVIVSNMGEQPVGFLSRTCPNPHQMPVELDCYSWSFDGNFHKKESLIKVDWPDGHRVVPIESLKVYTLKFDQSRLEERLESRGNMFWKCRGKKLVAYEAPGSIYSEKQKRYMVDFDMYRRYHADKLEPLGPDELGQDIMSCDEPPGGPFALLLPPNIFGFGFREKKWKNLLVDNIRETWWAHDPFDNLILDDWKKEPLMALVSPYIYTQHSTSVNYESPDGLVILLHGGPGTGKTLTAESVAEFTRRPLCRVSCGDIGIENEELEMQLKTAFSRGMEWGAVVLLEATDIFLAGQSQPNLQANAMMSVFLRLIESYRGILILKSKLVTRFNESVKSRVQLAVHYSSLAEDTRSKIWHNSISGLFKPPARVDQIQALAKPPLNGTQIRNIMHMATQMAKFRSEAFEFSHVHDAASDFRAFENDTTPRIRRPPLPTNAA